MSHLPFAALEVARAGVSSSAAGENVASDSLRARCNFASRASKRERVSRPPASRPVTATQTASTASAPTSQKADGTFLGRASQAVVSVRFFGRNGRRLLTRRNVGFVRPPDERE